MPNAGSSQSRRASSGPSWSRASSSQGDDLRQWGIRQKQSGADGLSLGGALGSNVHGRGLAMKPIIDDVEWFELVDAHGDLARVTRTSDQTLFRHVIGGYGLFGVVTAVGLRLAPRQKVERLVELVEVADLAAAFERRIADGFLYGDCQFAIDPKGDDFSASASSPATAPWTRRRRSRMASGRCRARNGAR